MARARTSCECILRAQDWTQRLEEPACRMEEEAGAAIFMWVNWTIFWSTPEV